MARPKVFISSTHFDLKHIRSSLENLVESLGYEAVLSEKGNIAYDPDIPLDESAYRDAQNADIFVLIVGGRYGSAASTEPKEVIKEFNTRYESITKREFASAIELGVPAYILVDNAVYSEYEIFKRNRDNTEIRYAEVDSANIFHFMDEILSLPRNNPVHRFEKYQDIEDWLVNQWAGLFRELIQKRSNQKELKELSAQVQELSNLNKTLKRYLEEVVTNVAKNEGKLIIKEEQHRIFEQNILNEFKGSFLGKDLMVIYNLDDQAILELLKSANNTTDVVKILDKYSPVGDNEYEVRQTWESLGYDAMYNKARSALGLHIIEFSSP